MAIERTGKECYERERKRFGECSGDLDSVTAQGRAGTCTRIDNRASRFVENPDFRWRRSFDRRVTYGQ